MSEDKNLQQSAPVSGDAENSNAYYKAMKKIEDEKKQKKKKKRKGCIIAVVLPVLLVVVAVIASMFTGETSVVVTDDVVTEPYTKLDIYQINQAAIKNQLAAEKQFRQNEDGYKYRYTFVAEVINVPGEQIFVKIANPKKYKASGEWNYYDAYLNVDKDFAATLKLGDWILVENACIEFGQTWHRIDQQYMETPKKITREEAVEFVNSYPDAE